jgi:hypothetical protein
LEAFVTKLVVNVALLRISEDLVSLGRLFKPLFSAFVTLIAIRVILECELTVGLLDRFLRGLTIYTENVVVVLLYHRHCSSGILSEALSAEVVRPAENSRSIAKSMHIS